MKIFWRKSEPKADVSKMSFPEFVNLVDLKVFQTWVSKHDWLLTAKKDTGTGDFVMEYVLPSGELRYILVNKDNKVAM